MTVSSTNNKIQYNGDGVTLIFAYDFLIHAEGDLRVILTNSSGVETVQTITTHYTVTGVGNPAGGTVVMVTAPASGEKLTIKRSLLLVQGSDYKNPNKLDMEVLERDMDEVVMMAQQLDEENDRALKLPESTAAGAQVLPDLDGAADKYLKIKSDESGVEYGDALPGTTPVALNPGDAGIPMVADDAETGLKAADGEDLAKPFYGTDTGAADAYVVALFPAPSAYVAGQIVKFKPANRNTGASTLNVNSLGVKNIKRGDGADPDAGDLSTTQVAALVYDGTNFILMNPARRFPKGHIHGLILSNGTDAAHDIDMTAGVCRAEGDDGDMVAAAITGKQADPITGWAAGNNASGMPITTKTGTFTTVGTAVTGSGTAFDTEFAVGDCLHSDDKGESRKIAAIGGAGAMTLESAFSTDVSVADAVKKGGLAPNAYQFVFLLGNPADPTDCDLGFDTDPAAGELLAAAQAVDPKWTLYRLLGGVITDGSANIVAFQMAEEAGGERIIRYETNQQDLNTTTAVAARALFACSVPLRIRVTVLGYFTYSRTAARFALVSSPDVPDVAPSSTNYTVETTVNNDTPTIYIRERTDTSGQLGHRESTAEAVTAIRFNTIGWIVPA